jgi:hypothetical protein
MHKLTPKIQEVMECQRWIIDRQILENLSENWVV